MIKIMEIPEREHQKSWHMKKPSAKREWMPNGYSHCDPILDANTQCIELSLIEKLVVDCFFDKVTVIEGQACNEFGNTITIYNNAIWKTDGEWLLIGSIPNQPQPWKMLDAIIRPDCLDYPFFPVMQFDIGKHIIPAGTSIGIVRLIQPNPDYRFHSFFDAKIHRYERNIWDQRKSGNVPTKHYRKAICSK